MTEMIVDFNSELLFLPRLKWGSGLMGLLSQLSFRARKLGL